MQLVLAYSLLIAIFTFFVCVQAFSNSTERYGDSEIIEKKVLSRRKRFIVFPDGSSFQLVICTQNHGYLQIGDIVWFGNTAALAWELPTDPTIFNLLKGTKKDFASRRQDNDKHIYYLDDKGQVLAKVPYRRKPIINPAFAKRDVVSQKILKIYSKPSITDVIKQLHEKQKDRHFLKSHHLNENDIGFHRNTRKELYSKLELFLETLGVRGRDCVLRMLCDAGKNNDKQTTFLEEILRAVFTLPNGPEFETESHKSYDEAHNTQEECHMKYTDCNLTTAD